MSLVVHFYVNWIFNVMFLFFPLQPSAYCVANFTIELDLNFSTTPPRLPSIQRIRWKTKTFIAMEIAPFSRGFHFSRQKKLQYFFSNAIFSCCYFAVFCWVIFFFLHCHSDKSNSHIHIHDYRNCVCVYRTCITVTWIELCAAVCAVATEGINQWVKFQWTENVQKSYTSKV